MIKMQDKANYKLGDSFTDKDTKTYYFDGLSWVSGLHILYKNYKGQTSERVIIPINVWYGTTEYHPKAGWLLTCWDVEKKAYRDFSMVDIVKIDK